MILDFDLNELPAEGQQFEDVAVLFDLKHMQKTILESPGSFSSPIDVDAIYDDDVILLPSSSWETPAKSLSSRKRPVAPVIDEILETNSWQSDEEEPETTLSLSVKKFHSQIPLGEEIIDYDLDINENCDLKKSEEMNPNPVAWMEASASSKTEDSDSAPSKELSLTCAVCLDSLNEASSTICGHMFCRSCIEASISKQKKCPICRRKLTKRNYHRVYFANAQGICFS